MINRLRRFFSTPLTDYFIPLLLLAVSGLAYGLLFLWQGYYWDDFPFTWIARTYGPQGLQNYFSTMRPAWGLLHQLPNSLLGEAPWQWQLFGLFWRWLSAVTFWLALRLVWPRQRFAVVLAALAYLVYPGFGQQPIANCYGHFFLLLSIFFFSFYASLLALQGGRRAKLWLAVALLCALINLVTLEYFYLLELLRPLLFAFSPALSKLRGRERFKRAMILWLPYLALFLAVTAWRLFFFPNQTFGYQPRALDDIKTNPLGGLLQLAWTWLSQTGIAGFAAWGKAYTLPDLKNLGTLNFSLYLLALLGGLLITLLLLIKSSSQGPDQLSENRRDGLAMAACGLFGLAVAGWPFFVTDLPVGLSFPNDRFTLPFMLGSSLFLAGLLLVLPLKQVPRILLAAALIVPSIGFHFLNATDYRRDWNLQKSFFWQLTWRAPGLAEGTTLLTNDLPLKYYSDNSLTAALNWFYAPDNRTQEMSYMLLYPAVRLGRSELPSLQPGTLIEVDYLAAVFHGNTNQTVVIYYQPPGCLRVLDGEIEKDNLFVPVNIREVAASLGSTEWILPQPDRPAELPADLYNPEPAHGWCYYFEKADLARQQGDWQQVAALADQAFGLGDYPNDPTERLPFIEGYAHVERWEQAMELTRQSADISPVMRPVLCRLWDRIDAQTPASANKAQALQWIDGELQCASD